MVNKFRTFFEPITKISYIQYESRYKFAQDYIKDKAVLDVGCGARQGAFKLSSLAHKVIAVDLSYEALKFNREKWTNADINYLVMNGLNLGFKDKKFQVVISFEVIEHIKKYNKYLSEICRVLENKGTFIMSTPNREYEFANILPHCELHAHEFSYKELKETLEQYFCNIDIYGQTLKANAKESAVIPYRVYGITRYDPFNFRKIIPKIIRDGIYKKLIKLFSGKKNIPLEEELTADDIDITKENVVKTSNFIVVCQKKN